MSDAASWQTEVALQSPGSTSSAGQSCGSLASSMSPQSCSCQASNIPAGLKFMLKALSACQLCLSLARLEDSLGLPVCAARQKSDAKTAERCSL